MLSVTPEGTMYSCGLATSICGPVYALCLVFFLSAFCSEVTLAEPERPAPPSARGSETAGRNSLEGASGLPKNHHGDYADYAAQLLGWDRLQSAVQNLQDFSLQGLQKNVENINLYASLQGKLDKIRNRVPQAGLADEPPGYREQRASASEREQGRAVARAGSGEGFAERKLPGEVDSEVLSGWPLEGLITALPAQIQEQIKKNLEIEQAILEQKLLMQQLALNKQIEELRKEVGIDEWLELWGQLGSQVSDKPSPAEEPNVDSEAAELLDTLVSKFPQLFTEREGTQADTAASVQPVQHRTVDGQSEDTQERSHVLPNRASASGVDNRRRSEFVSGLNKTEPAAESSPAVFKVTQPTAKLTEVQGAPSPSAGSSVGRPGSGTTGGVDRTFSVADTRSSLVSHSPDRLQNTHATPFLPTIHASRNENGLLKALEHQPKVSKDNLIAPSLRGSLDPRVASTESTKGSPSAAGDDASMGSSLSSMREPKEQVGAGAKPESLRNGPLLTLVKTLRDMLVLR